MGQSMIKILEHAVEVGAVSWSEWMILYRTHGQKRQRILEQCWNAHIEIHIHAVHVLQFNLKSLPSA